MKDVMISIRPKWCELEATGEKTDEVRKTRPKINTPFKCYIYCTKIKDKKKYSDEFDTPTNTRKWLGNGKVIGEFVCDKITYITADIINGTKHLGNTFGLNTCLTYEELFGYIYRGKGRENCGRCWHISDLKIYDEPKELSEFGISRPPQSWQYCEELEEK